MPNKETLAMKKADLCVEIAQLELELKSRESVPDRAASLMRRSERELQGLRKRCKKALAA